MNYLYPLADLSQLNIDKILSLIKDIDEKLQLANKPKIYIHWKSRYDTELLRNKIHNEEDYRQTRFETLGYLESINVIKEYRTHGLIYEEMGLIDVVVNINRFKKFKEEIQKSYDEKIATNKINDLNKIDVPDDTKWEDVKIKFIDGLTVKLTIKDKAFDKDFRELGFEDKRQHKPNLQWKLLELLAHKKGELSWEDSEATDKVKQKKHNLSKKLKEIFGINDDPFYPYSTKTGYQIKITLIPYY